MSPSPDRVLEQHEVLSHTRSSSDISWPPDATAERYVLHTRCSGHTGSIRSSRGSPHHILRVPCTAITGSPTFGAALRFRRQPNGPPYTPCAFCIDIRQHTHSHNLSRYSRVNRRWVDNIQMHLVEIGWCGVDWIGLKNGVSWDVTPCGSCKNRRFVGT
jgi:hypothetical protein